jgi:SAM-dependent methyltransferase
LYLTIPLEAMMADYTLALDTDAINRLNTMAAGARTFEAPAWAEAGITRGATVLDIGCGTGAFLGEFAKLVGADGRAIGLDSSEASVEACSAYLAHLGLPQASVRLGDAFTCDLDSERLDAAHLRLLLIHLGSRVNELLAVVRSLVCPGGHVVLTDVDGPSCGLSETIPELEELMQAWLTMMSGRGNDVRIGIHLPALAVAAGFEIIDFRGAMTVIPPSASFRLPHWEARAAIVADGVASQADVDRWEPTVTEFVTARTAYFSLPMYTLVARRPA